MSSHTRGDGFHEIELNGKQLVFLVMAATVVSVVIFLLGVFVGRDVRAAREASTQEAAVEDLSSAALSPAPPPAQLPAAVPADPSSVAPPPVVDELSYLNRLERESAPAEELKAPERPARAADKPAAAAVPPPKPPPPAVTASREPSAGQGYVVQIAALNARNEADAMVRRFSTKGYQAYVQSPADGPSNVYRVRIGPYKSRRDADAAAAKLRKEEQLNPWVTQP